LDGPIADQTGALFGTASYGGAYPSGCEGFGCGAVFKLMPPAAGQSAWTLTTLASFSGGRDGRAPAAGLVGDGTGALYGTTSGGGSQNCGPVGCGTVFQIANTGTLTTIWSFSGGSDGAYPSGPLLRAETGVLYGTTQEGGSLGGGTAFAIDPVAGTITTVWSFSGGSDGGGPSGGLLADDTGALYGTTYYGGGASDTCPFGCGTVFKLTPPATDQTAWTLTTLWTFLGGSDGANPSAPLIADQTGAFYGTTSVGGSYSCSNNFDGGCGTVFMLTPPAAGQSAWTETVLYAFSGGWFDGAFPFAGVIADQTGALYGTTNGGTYWASGIVFQLTPPSVSTTAWTETVLWAFSGGSDGGNPAGALLADATGALYGTAEFGGTQSGTCILGAPEFPGCGVVFKLTGTGFTPLSRQSVPVLSSR
jgi:uncharacterized repeat protein (TIGR03803 family)